MWWTLAVLALAVTAYAVYRYRKPDRSRTLPPVATYVCTQCGEKDCHCHRQH
jgi:hypothetical protein